MKIIFDIGANQGGFTKNFLNDSEYSIFAFEPTPFMLSKLYKIQDSAKNYTVIPYAISDFDGEADFFIAGQGDWGCSSLNTFSENLDKTWTGRTDFVVTEKIKVKTTRMDTFLNKNNVSKIDFLKIDVQGNDLKVLQSFGNYINIVQQGVAEAANQNPLYKEVDNSLDSISEFLKIKGFEITSIHPNDIFKNEVNVFFKRNGIQSNDILKNAGWL